MKKLLAFLLTVALLLGCCIVPAFAEDAAGEPTILLTVDIE